MLAGYTSPLSNHHLILAVPPKEPTTYSIPEQYELSLYSEHFTKSALNFKPLVTAKRNVATHYTIRVKTTMQEYLINSCFGSKCLVKDSRTVIHQKGSHSSNTIMYVFMISSLLAIALSIYCVKRGQAQQIKKTQNLMDSIIGEEDMDSKRKQKMRLKKEMELQN